MPVELPASTVRFTVLGVPVRVEGDAAVVAEVAALLADAARPVTSVPPTAGQDCAAGTEAAVRVHRSGRWYTVVGGSSPSRVDGPATAVAHVLAAVNAAALARANCLAVHAAVVARQGRAVAFPAASGQGKSTLAAACLLGGWDYVSDEALCLHWATGAVLAYPRPMELSEWSRAATGLPATTGPAEAFLTAAQLGARVAVGPLELEHLVLLERGDGVALDPLPRRDGVAALLTRSFNHWRNPGRAFDLAHEVVSRATVWRLRLGDPRTAATLLRRTLSEQEDGVGGPVGRCGGDQPGWRDTSDR